MTMAGDLDIAYRQSAINEYMICGYRTKLRIENPDHPRRTSVMRAIGTGYHGGLAKGYMMVMGGEPPTIDAMNAAAVDDLRAELYEHSDSIDWRYQTAGKRQEEIVYDEAQCIATMAYALRKYVEDNRWWPFERYEVLGVEQPFLIDWGQRKRRGTMDLIVRDIETGWVHVVDHKLTRRKWYERKAGAGESVQAAWYVDAAKALYGTDHVTFNYDVMTTSGDFQRFDAHRTEIEINLTMDKAAAVAEAIEKGGPFIPNTSSFLCSEAFCDYWDLCPYGQGLNGK